MTQRRFGNILGLDWGKKRIGVACARSGVDMVFPYGIIENDRDVWTRLHKIVSEEQVTLIVIGIPLSLRGTVTPQTQSAREFGKQAERTLGIEIVFEDERLSSRGAQALIDQREVRSHHTLKDDIAAQIILQSYVDRTGNMSSP